MVQVAAADELTTIVVAADPQPRLAVMARIDALIKTKPRRVDPRRTQRVAITVASRPWSPRGVPKPIN